MNVIILNFVIANTKILFSKEENEIESNSNEELSSGDMLITNFDI